MKVEMTVEVDCWIPCNNGASCVYGTPNTCKYAPNFYGPTCFFNGKSITLICYPPRTWLIIFKGECDPASEITPCSTLAGANGVKNCQVLSTFDMDQGALLMKSQWSDCTSGQ